LGASTLSVLVLETSWPPVERCEAPVVDWSVTPRLPARFRPPAPPFSEMACVLINNWNWWSKSKVSVDKGARS